jgi:4-hydroxy-2-oxoheptanedioate aldolase
VVPLVRIPPNAREGNQWIIKQSLDAGVYGLVVPHLDTVEQARAAVVASRYPQVPGAPDFEPAGQRGWWYRLAPRYWGLTPEEYYEAADLWPLDPAGDMLLMPIVESVQGIRNLSDILAAEKGIGAIWAGPADLAVEIGARGNVLDPRVEEGVEEILRTCRRFNVPCAIKAGPAEVEQRIDQGFRIIVSSPARVDRALELGRKAAAR